MCTVDGNILILRMVPIYAFKKSTPCLTYLKLSKMFHHAGPSGTEESESEKWEINYPVEDEKCLNDQKQFDYVRFSSSGLF